MSDPPPHTGTHSTGPRGPAVGWAPVGPSQHPCLCPLRKRAVTSALALCSTVRRPFPAVVASSRGGSWRTPGALCLTSHTLGASRSATSSTSTSSTSTRQWPSSPSPCTDGGGGGCLWGDRQPPFLIHVTPLRTTLPSPVLTRPDPPSSPLITPVFLPQVRPPHGLPALQVRLHDHRAVP